AAHTPHMDALAASGVRFERAYSVAPLTTPAHASMLTGLYPPRHGIHSNGDATLDPRHQTLAEEAAAAGMATGASVAAFVTTRIWGFAQGFEHFADQIEATGAGRGERWGRERRADAVVDDALVWLDGQGPDRPFFLWVHLYDPHDPYDPPAPWSHRLTEPYDGEIAFMDAEIGRLVAGAEAAAGERGVAWILVGDHGEALDGEHGERSHGTWVYDPTMRIPFILRGPRPMAGRVEASQTVSNVDVMPTALGMLGMEPLPDLDGRDLSKALVGPAAKREPVYMESEAPLRRFGFHPELAAAEGPYKLLATPSPRLFDVDADPRETRDLQFDHPTVVLRLQRSVDDIQGRRIEASSLAAGPELTARLAALGYVAGSADTPRAFADLPDAKEQQAFITRVEAARALHADPKAAIDAWKAILSDQPDLGEARLALAALLLRAGATADAERMLREGVAQRPDSTLMRTQLADVIASRGRPEEALVLLEAVHAQVPGDDLARVGILRALAALGRLEDAQRRANAWLSVNPGSRPLQAAMGVLQVQAGQLAIASTLLQRSLEDGVARRGVHRSLGLIALARDDLDGVIHHLTQESAAWPGDARTRWELGNALMRRERWDEAAAEYAALVRLQPSDPGARRAWAQATFNAGDYARAAELLEPALALAPDDSAVLLLHANILDKQGETARAEAVFRQAKAAAGR
ncbi:MAG: sulfatase-like hydrolase/transferase, partial [Myxococcota bacterium]|nr:sulfatase-like hydrolase/transferase [Myxococcota bacterium]